MEITHFTTELFYFSLLLLRAFVGLFWGVSLFVFRKSSRQNFPLSCIFIIMGFLLVIRAFTGSVQTEPKDVFNVTSYLIMVFIAPFTIFYAFFAVKEEVKWKTKLLHFLPFAILSVLWIINRSLNIPHVPPVYSVRELIGHFSEYPLDVSYFILLVLVFIGQVFTYFGMAFVRLVRIKKIYKNHNFSTRPVNYLLAMDWLFLFYPLFGVLYLSTNNTIITFIHIFFVPFVITLLALLNLRLQLPLKADFSFIEEGWDAGRKVSVQEVANDTCIEQDELYLRIKELFEKKEIYRHPQLNLQAMAKYLNTNKTYVSLCINKHYNCNFTHLINTYRIAAAKILLLETEKSIQEIAWEVGYNTRSSFYNAFKEHVHETLSPSDWRKEYVSKKLEKGLYSEKNLSF